jgi:RNA recognition motif-containing protein
MISKHFAACAPGQKIKVRLLSHKETGKSRGIAFVEMPDAESGERGLLLDHSVLDGRRIRVEPTAKGSGNTASRQDAIKSLKQQHEQEQRRRVTQALDEAFADYGHGKGERAKIHRSDVDDGVMEFLCTIPMVLVEKAVAEAVELDVGTIRNKSAYLMGFLKSKVAQLSQDPANLKASSDAGGTGKGRRGRADEHESSRKGAHNAHRKETGGGGGAEEQAEAAPGVGAAASSVAPIDFFSAEPLKRKRLVLCCFPLCGV